MLRSGRRLRNLAGKGLAARQKIAEALRKEEPATKGHDGVAAGVTPAIRKALRSPTQPALFS